MPKNLPAPVPVRPESGLVALLRAIGLPAIEIAPGVAALQTTVKR